MAKLGSVRKVVWFNLDDEHQKELYELANEIEFGKEVKKVLGERLRRRKALQQQMASQRAAAQSEDK